MFQLLIDGGVDVEEPQQLLLEGAAGVGSSQPEIAALPWHGQQARAIPSARSSSSQTAVQCSGVLSAALAAVTCRPHGACVG